MSPCAQFERERYPALVLRCNYCKNSAVPEEVIGVDQLLQALLDTITVHKSPAEVMERLELRRYGDQYRRERS